MRVLSILALAVLAIFAGLATAHAENAAWRITALEGSVRVTMPGQAAADAAPNETLPVGSIVTTGAGSRAVVENGAQRIEVSANGRMTIAANSDAGMTRILQDLGTLLFKVDHKEVQHFQVETPLLAAVVKGTTFAVTASPQQDVVHVVSGLVEVHANKGGATRDVASGETATVSRDAPEHLGFLMPSKDVPGDERAGSAPLDYASLSNGIVSGPDANGRWNGVEPGHGLLANGSQTQLAGLVGGLSGGLGGGLGAGGGGGLVGGVAGGVGGLVGGVAGGVGGLVGGLGGTLGGTLGGAVGGVGGVVGGLGGAVGGAGGALGGGVGGALGGVGGALGGLGGALGGLGGALGGG